MTDSAQRLVSPQDRWWLGQLIEWIRIPSVSGDDRHRGDLQQAARWLVRCLRRTGASTAVVPSAGSGPTVLGGWRGPPGAPVVLMYGHYDVQPAGPGWTVPPFGPTVRWPLLVGRGTNDDKGQLLAMLAALTAGRNRPGTTATTVLIADGGEEIGSPGLPSALTRLARTLRPDLVLVCDTERSAAGAPTVTVSQRGHVVMDIDVDSGGPAVHSGRLGGAVIDPTVVLAAALARMSDTVAGWPTADPRGPAESGATRRLPDRAIIRAAHGRVTTGEDLHRRITDEPSLSIARLATSGGRGSIAARAGARIDVRLPPRSPVAVAVRSLHRSALLGSGSIGVRCTVVAASPGHAAVPDRDVLAAIDRASTATFGRPTVPVRSGGSLPAASMLHQAFGTPPVLLGLGTPAGGAHGPDEFLDIPGWITAVQMLAMIFRSVPSLPHSDLPQIVTQRSDTPDKYVKRCAGAPCAPF